MTQHADSQSVKKKNIIDMALSFTAMMRIFSKGSNTKIAEKLGDLFENLVSITSRDDYGAHHRGFCVWFTREILTAGKKMKSGEFRQGEPASFGQGAKVLDIATKVYVYYCSQPNVEIAQRLEPLLNGAIDTPILEHLKSTHAATKIRAKTIKEIDEEAYRALQSLVLKESFSLGVHPVQYDDIMWRELNR